MSRNARTLSLLSVVLLVGSFVAFDFGSPIAHANTTTRIYFVDNTGDADLSPPNQNACEIDTANNDCSLRQAILKANVDGGTSTIDFSTLIDDFDPNTLVPVDPGYNVSTGRWTIKPTSQLPSLSEGGTTIIGRNDNAAQTPRIIIDGSSLAGSVVGIRLTSDANVLQRLILVNFSGNTATTGYAVRITRVSPGIDVFDNQILGCYIGVLPQSSVAAPNQRGGILIDSGAGFTRIGATGTNRNIISGNGTVGTQGDGITILGPAENNVIEGNYIGIALDSGFTVISMPNTGYGIQIADSTDNTIGGANANQRNVIANNGQSGVLITGSQAVNNRILANYIGVGENGVTDRGNAQHGIAILDGANGNFATGSAAAPLVVSGNGGYGVLIGDLGTDRNTVIGAYIGLSGGGTAAVANASGGIRIQDNAKDNVIGTATLGNVIAGNIGYGASIGRQNPGANNTSGNTIRNNIIGLNFSGLTAVANTVGGVLIDSSAKTTIIGGLAASEGNIISGNGTVGAPNPTGIVINTTEVLSTTVTGNKIGLRRTIVSGPFNTSAPNQGGGIFANAGANQIQIGGTLDQANTIAFNAGNGVVIGSAATNILINANSVLTNTLGGIIVTSVPTPTIQLNTVLGNQGGPGIQLTSSPDALITENTIRANNQAGLSISGSNRLNVLGNTISNNGQSGIAISGGDVPLLEANTSNSNGQYGISISGGATRGSLRSNTTNQNTLSGVNITASSPITVSLNILLRNTGGAGLSLTGPANKVILDSNDIRLNGVNGIAIVGVNATTNLTVTNNTIRDNTGTGVLLTGDMNIVSISANQIISNTVNGVQVGNGGAFPHPQRVRILDNAMSRNGIAPSVTTPVSLALQALGIVLNPKSSGTPGTTSNPNHDIDPPIVSTLVVSQASGGILTGRVLADSTSAACTTNPVSDCTIQLFNTDAQILDGQGFQFIGTPTLTSNGFFTSTLGFMPTQLALTATDKNGNTSEFAVFNANPQVQVSPAQLFNASPGDVITMTHRITNTGNIAFTKLQINSSTLSSLSNWGLTPSPGVLFSLSPGQSRLISVTLRLPTGADPQVRAGTTGPITITLTSGSNGADALTGAGVVNTVTILPRVVLDVSDGLSGSGLPSSILTYPHTVTNNGNITTTVTFSVATTVGGQPAPTWTTSISPTSIILGPGRSGSTTIRVTVSSGAQSNTVAQTTLTATPDVNGSIDSSQIKTVVDTTSTNVQESATIVSNLQQDGAAGEEVSFRHFITNTSNGAATFKLQAVSSQGSLITFTSLTNGIPIVNGNTFTIPSNVPGFNQLEIFVTVRVDRRVLPGQKDSVTVILTNATGSVVGGASVQDTVNVTRGLVVPRLWLPWIAKP